MFASLFNVDVDECTSFPNICGANADCHNTDGSYICNCKGGYTGDGKVLVTQLYVISYKLSGITTAC